MGVVPVPPTTTQGKCYTVSTIVTKQVTQIQQEIVTEFVQDGVVVDKKQEEVCVCVCVCVCVFVSCIFPFCCLLSRDWMSLKWFSFIGKQGLARIFFNRRHLPVNLLTFGHLDPPFIVPLQPHSHLLCPCRMFPFLRPLHLLWIHMQDNYN